MFEGAFLSEKQRKTAFLMETDERDKQTDKKVHVLWPIIHASCDWRRKKLDGKLSEPEDYLTKTPLEQRRRKLFLLGSYQHVN